MGSRIRENVKHLFQCFCEVVRPQPHGQDAWIIQKFPESYKDEEVLKSVPKFAYPCDFLNNVVQHYSFVLTDIDSKWTFGFCRHDPKTETALVILSFLPWHESFYKLLNHIAQITHRLKADELWKFLGAVYQSKVPDPGGTVQIYFNGGNETFICQCPNQFQLPSIPENRNLTEYYSAVDGHNMMVIFASMLYERRIIFTSKKLYRLSACVQSANAVIYPMNWQHIFIPVLPMALMDYLLAPMPYLIGVPEQVLERVRKPDLGEVVLLNADTNTIETPFDDLASLPQDVVTSLKRQLRNRAALLGDGVSRAFLRALVQLIGGYRDALKFQQGQKITFSSEAFVESRPVSMQPFLRKMLELQIFQQFIEERLEMLNDGLGFSDEFEMEACNYSGKSSSKLKQQYKEWTYTMRKEGSAFFKNVKSKANPAVKSAVKSVKERGKDVRLVYKEFRSKFRENAPRDGIKSIGPDRRDKPLSAPSSPIPKRHTVYTTKASFRKEPYHHHRTATTTDSRNRAYSPLSPSSDPSSPDPTTTDKSRSNTPGLQLSPLDMDLMGDLQDLIFKKRSSLLDDTESPPVDRSLKPVRSLESFRHQVADNSDYTWCQESDILSPPVSPRHGALLSFPASVSPTASLNKISSFPLPDSSPKNNSSVAASDFDLFGAAPFVVGSGGGTDAEPMFVVASPSSLDLVRLPPPAQTQSSSGSWKQQADEDLICLDTTTPSDDFDPLSLKNTVDRSPIKNVSQIVQTFENQGTSNPLYTYVNPSKTDKVPNQSFLHQAHPVNSGIPYPINSGVLQPANSSVPNQSFLHKPVAGSTARTLPSTSTSRPLQLGLNHSNVNYHLPPSLNQRNHVNQDMALLKEYGLDFNSLTLQNGSYNIHAGNTKISEQTTSLVSDPKDPFRDLLSLSKDNKQDNSVPQFNWTRFE